MNVIERAIEVIEDEHDPYLGPIDAPQLVYALSGDGLLKPDLPEPEMDDDRLVWRVDKDGFVYIDAHGQIATVGVKTPYGSPAIALRHAFAIIAAANHTEQE